MAFGFPAYHTDRYSVENKNPTDMLVAVQETIRELSWSIREENSDQIIASTSMNLRSWGEKVLINVLQDNSISITSKCALPTQCLDWGKNKANVDKFIAEIMKHL